MSVLHTEGRRIKNAFGETVQLRGCARSHLLKMADPVNEAIRLRNLGVSWLRLFVHYETWIDPVGGGVYQALVDQYVSSFTQRGIYVSIVNMSNYFMNDVDSTGWIAFIMELVNRYKDNPRMYGIAIWNEPPLGILGINRWYSWVVQAAEAINAVNSNLLILVNSGLPNRKGIDTHWVDNPVSVPNVVYYFHDYFWQHFYYNTPIIDDFALKYNEGDFETAKILMEEQYYNRFFKYAVENDMCIVHDEFGFNGGLNPANKGYGNEPGWSQCQIDYMDMLEKYEIPWNQYSWWVKTEQNYGLAEESDYYTLSPVGEIWARYLLAPISPLSMLIRAALSAATGVGLIWLSLRARAR